MQEVRTGGALRPCGFSRSLTNYPLISTLYEQRLVPKVTGFWIDSRTIWASGTMRFDRPGEALLAAYSEGVLAAIGGITIDPIVRDALRMRRFYVRAAFRRAGIGGQIAQALLKRAGNAPVVTVNAAVKSVPFWETLGFVPQALNGHTHVWREAEPRR